MEEERRERKRMRGREGRAGGGEGRGHTGVNKRKCSPDASATTTLHRAHHKHFKKQATPTHHYVPVHTYMHTHMHAHTYIA